MAKRSSRSTPTGPGSRGGERWSDKEWRNEYHRRWRVNHPEYRQQEKLRKLRRRAAARGEDPTLVTLDDIKMPGRLPTLAVACMSCGNPIPVSAVCGFCKVEVPGITQRFARRARSRVVYVKRQTGSRQRLVPTLVALLIVFMVVATIHYLATAR